MPVIVYAWRTLLCTDVARLKRSERLTPTSVELEVGPVKPIGRMSELCPKRRSRNVCSRCAQVRGLSGKAALRRIVGNLLDFW